MKKYYQAALLVTALVSLVSLLFYRHEYNKLRYVLEVFNYFGKPNQRSAETNCTDNVSIFSKFSVRLEEPTSSWQRLENDLYVYSAYNIRDKEIQAVGLASLNVIKDVQCAVLFENTVPILGSFSSIPIDNGTNVDKNFDHRGYHFYCAYTRNEIPVGVMFLTEFDSNQFEYDATPILPLKTQPQSLDYTNAAICIIPPTIRSMQLSQMISFINFHDLIGVDNFIVYDFGIPNDFNSRFRELSRSQSPYWKFTYTVLPWNFPFLGLDSSIIRDLIQADCLYRTYNKVMYVVAISWEEYIVLKYHHTLTDLMKDYKKSRLKAERYKLSSSTFCTQQTDSPAVKNVSYTIFKKFTYYPNVPDNQPIYIYNTHEVLSRKNIFTRDIGKDLATVNHYTYCRGNQFYTETGVEDKSIARFVEDIQSSQMFRTFAKENKLLLNAR
ncbi:uncharacterized protein LOC108622196 [Ceratina calcarata]|uniref:Glycosyltransferase family 92 protein n=1 Tax=Ceratina calcarata TaxID=156304 RepID=A0AAJ7IRR1_9HYME|nr:uncharacterized protein LOC108622196 [Ceratina calcarata]XP_017875396.1 uncharacterized protein LOC108622196 [Ceratina calcarata]